MLKLVKKHLRGAWLFTLLAPLSMILEVLMDLRQPQVMSEIVDIGIPAGDISFILSKGQFMLLVALVGAVGGIGCTVCSSFAGMRFGRNLRQSLFDHIQTFSFREIDAFSTSSLITRLTNDVTQVQNMLIMALRMLVRAPSLCIGGLIMAYLLSPKLSLIFVIAVPFLFVTVTLIIRKAYPMFSQMQTRIDRVNTVMRENLLGVRVVKAFVGQEHERGRFKAANEDLMGWSVRASNVTIMMMPVVSLVLYLSVISLYWFGGNMVNTGDIEIGKIMAFSLYLSQVLNSLMMVVMMMMNFSRAQASVKRINEVLETESSIADPAEPKTMNGFGVEFDHVYFRYNEGGGDGESEGEYVLKDISFSAEEGQTIGIIGATGSGKSTLISLFSRLYDVSSGSVRIGGVDVRELGQDELRGKIGIVLQESILFSGSVGENLRWSGDNCTEEALEQAVTDAQAHEFVFANSDRYNAVVEQRGKNFSGGQKQRLSIARTLAKHAPILILDDSTSAVDTATEAKIRHAITQNRKNQIVFIVAQRISAISKADKIIVLDNGEVNGTGTHAELIKTNEIYRSIVASQLGEEALSYAG